MKKLDKIPVVIAAVLAISGCASSSVKQAVSNVNDSDVAYGLVTEITDADNNYNRNFCKAKPVPSAWMSFCDSVRDYSQVRLAVLHHSRVVSGVTAVPKNWNVQIRSVVKFSPKHGGPAISLAAKAPREDCRWVDGPDPLALNSVGGTAVGFLAGLLIVPALVVAADDSVLQGGVVCDGWSYRNLVPT